MRKLYSLLTLSFILPCTASFAQQPVKAGTIVKNRAVTERDSTAYYEVAYSTHQKSYMNLLAGNWSFTTMHRQAKTNAENLSNINLTINADSTFTGSVGCSKVSGKLSIKGTSIKFNSIDAVNNNCSLSERESWFLKLLSAMVSNYTVTDNHLLLQDGSSKVVFEANKNDASLLK